MAEDVWGILGILKGTLDMDLKSGLVYLRAVQFLRCVCMPCLRKHKHCRQ